MIHEPFYFNLLRRSAFEVLYFYILYFTQQVGSENEIVYSMYQKPNDWVPVGTYYLEKGKVKMKLYDRGAFPGQLIFADAVKWVKK